MATTQTQEQPAENLVDWDKFDGNMLASQSHQEKKFDQKNEAGNVVGEGKYYELPLQYNYGGVENPRVDGFFIQLPKLKSDGVRKKAGLRGYDEYSMKFSFDLSKADQKKCVDVLDKDIYNRIAQLVFLKKGPIGMQYFSVENPRAGLKGLIYWPADPNTKEIIVGKNPTQFFKMTKRTLFTDLHGNPIPWDLLIDAEVEGYPLIHYSHLYANGNGNASPQAKLVSMVVTSVEALGTQTRQTATIERIAASDPNAVMKLEEQIAALMAQKQDIMSVQGAPAHTQMQQTGAPPMQAQMQQIGAPPMQAQMQQIVPQAAPAQGGDLGGFLAGSAASTAAPAPVSHGPISPPPAETMSVPQIPQAQVQPQAQPQAQLQVQQQAQPQLQVQPQAQPQLQVQQQAEPITFS